MKTFTFGELWGPFDCEDPDNKCGNNAWTCLLTDDEVGILPTETGPEAAQAILLNHIGTMLCPEHLEKRTEGVAKLQS